MLWSFMALLLGVLVLATSSFAHSTQGLYNLVQRRMPLHADFFEFFLVEPIGNGTVYDQYTILSTSEGKIRVEGTTVSALSSG